MRDTGFFVAFGGSLISIAILYAWIAAVPLREGETWAWWTFVASGVLGFGSFLAYLGYGLTLDGLNAVNPRLVPLIAHDRAGFGVSGVCETIGHRSALRAKRVAR